MQEVFEYKEYILIGLISVFVIWLFYKDTRLDRTDMSDFNNNTDDKD